MQSTSRQFPHSQRSRFFVKSVWLRLLLMLFVWQGPFPIWHFHGTATESAVPSEVFFWLTGHLRHFHSAVSPSDDVHFGWHVHLCVPQPGGQDGGHSPDRPSCDHLLPAEMTEAFAVGDSLLSVRHSSDFSPSGLSYSGLDQASVQMTLGAPGFHSTFARSLALPIRFCVSRC